MVKVGKEVLFVLVIALAVFIAGCQGGGKGATSSSSTPFIGGTEGLRMSFLPNAPPTEVFDNGQLFDITLRVENVGERKIAANNLKVTVGGIYPTDFGLTPQSTLKTELEGVTKDPDGGRIPGGINDVPFANLAYAYKGKLEGNTEFPIQVDACYSYETVAVSDICMRQKLITPTPGVCQVKGSRRVFNSGGPVQLVSVDESLGGSDKVVLKFVIRAVGSGSFFQWGSGCDKGDLQTESFVNVAIDTGLSGGLECSGWGGAASSKVRLTNGEASITCIQTVGKFDSVKPIKVTMDYDHSISTSTKLLVKHLPGIGAAVAPPGVPAQQPRPGQPGATLTWTDYKNKCEFTNGRWDSLKNECDCGSGKVWKPYPVGCVGVQCKEGQTGSCLTVGTCEGTRSCKSDGTWNVCVNKYETCPSCLSAGSGGFKFVPPGTCYCDAPNKKWSSTLGKCEPISLTKSACEGLGGEWKSDAECNCKPGTGTSWNGQNCAAE